MIGVGRHHRKDERNREILEKRRSGMKLQAIADDYGITYQRVRDIVLNEERLERIRNGTPREFPPPPKFEWTTVVMNPDQDADILAMWRSGSTYHEIASWFRISSKTAAAAVKRQLKKEADEARQTSRKHGKSDNVDVFEQGQEGQACIRD